MWNIAAISTGRPLSRAMSSSCARGVTLPLVSMNRPRPDSPIARTSALISRSSASREGIGMPPQPLCGSLVEVAKPTAPLAIASRTSAAMRSISSSVAAR